MLMQIFRSPWAVAPATVLFGFALPAQALLITLSETNCSAYKSSVDVTSGDITISCASTTPPPPPTNTPPTGCTLSGSATTITAGATYTLTAKCTAGDLPIAFSVSGGPSAVPAMTQNQANTAVTYSTNTLPVSTTPHTFTATATNAASPAGSPTAVTGSPSVTVSAPPPTGGGGTIACAPYKTHVIDLAWPITGSVKAYTIDYGGFGVGEAVVVTFKTPDTGTSTSSGLITFAEAASQSTMRIGVLSETACNFTKGLLGKAGKTISFPFAVGSPAGYNEAQLQPGTRYYLNILNQYRGVETCAGSCNGVVELLKPGGM